MIERMIKLDNIEVRFGSFIALQNINIDIHEGEFFTFLGPSGCGKTTTLRTITGFIKPSAGRVYVRDADITDTPVEKRNVGMVFQSYALFPTMSVYENIAFGLKVQKLPKDKIREKVYAMAEKVELSEEQLKKKVSELSGGQQQRVAIARALVTSPEIICLDEPLSNLDAKLRVQLRNELKDLQRKFGIKKKGQLQRLVGVRGVADVHLLQTWFAPADEGGKLPFDAGKFCCAERCAKGAEIRHAEVLIKHGVALPGIENAGQVIGHGLDDVRCFHGIALVALLPGMAQPFQKAQS